MATETQRSPMLQTESNPEGVMQLLVVFCGTHLVRTSVHACTQWTHNPLYCLTFFLMQLPPINSWQTVERRSLLGKLTVSIVFLCSS